MNGALRAESRLGAALTGLAVVSAAGVGGVIAGVPGIAAGVALVAAWLVAPPVFVVALGHVLFAAVLPADASVPAIVLVEVPLLAILLVDLVDREAPVRTLAATVATLAAFGGLVVAGVRWLPGLLETAALLVLVAAAVGYGLHRYTVVTFEMTDEF